MSESTTKKANWMERGISFGLGLLTGGGLTATGLAVTNSIRTAEEREAANAAEKLAATKTKAG